ncbi:tyrosine-type recombinase/integrase [Marinilactibacillus psychrotolerans]|uniref:site-specific integrase n=1 Tax=Marinilactibacillus psychrotolerans TaxID=191770 RepID=UPI00388B78ED
MIKKYKLKNGDTRYMFHSYIGVDPVTDKDVYRKRSGFKTKKEAEIAEARLINDFHKNGFPSQRKRSTFNDVYDLWLESEYIDNVQESTLNKTMRDFKNHIVPFFDGMNIREIKPDHCQSELNKWRDKLVNYRRIKNYAHRVFDYALRMDIIDSNPFDKVTVPKRIETIEESEFENFYSKEELNEFLEYVKEDLDLNWYTYFRLLAYSGARKSELLALKWSDIDFDTSTLNINKTLTRGLNNKIIVQPTKTVNGRRVIDMDYDSMKLLKQWKMYQAQFMLKLGFNTNTPDQHVFANTRNNFYSINVPNDRMRNVQKRNGLKQITVHGLRHTHCSILFSMGASIKDVQARLGHTDIQTTMNIYAHVTKEEKKDTADKFAKFMEN